MKVLLNMIAVRLTEDLCLLPEAGMSEVIEAVPYASTRVSVENTLYIVDGTETGENLAVVQYGNLLYMFPPTKALPQSLKQQSYVFYDKSVEELCSEIKQIIKDLQRWGDELFEIMHENRGLHTLIQHANRMLLNPVIVFDTSYKILGYSSNLDVARDKAWQRSLESGYVALSDEQFGGIKTMILSTRSQPDENIYDYPQFENRFFHKNILYSNRHLAHLTIIEQVCEISAGQISLASYICAILSIELQKKEMSISKAKTIGKGRGQLHPMSLTI